MKTTGGFTLVEVMVVAVIVTILAMVSYPSYMTFITKTRRAEAQSLLAQDAAYMERLFSQVGCYNPTSAPVCDATAEPVSLCPDSPATPPTPMLPYCQSPASGTAYYTISIATTASTYTLTATPVSGRPQANDGTLTLSSTGAKTWSANPSGNTNSWQ